MVAVGEASWEAPDPLGGTVAPKVKTPLGYVPSPERLAETRARILAGQTVPVAPAPSAATITAATTVTTVTTAATVAQTVPMPVPVPVPVVPPQTVPEAPRTPVRPPARAIPVPAVRLPVRPSLAPDPVAVARAHDRWCAAVLALSIRQGGDLWKEDWSQYTISPVPTRQLTALQTQMLRLLPAFRDERRADDDAAQSARADEMFLVLETGQQLADHWKEVDARLRAVAEAPPPQPPLDAPGEPHDEDWADLIEIVGREGWDYLKGSLLFSDPRYRRVLTRGARTARAPR